MERERKQILEMVESGQISPEEAVELLNAMNGAEPSHETGSSDETPIGENPAGKNPAPPRTEIPRVGNIWLYPVITGAVVMTIGAPLMALGLTGGAHVIWAVLCGWLPFFVGLAILTVGLWSRHARWLHLRITNQQSGKRTLALSLPLPLTLAAWVLKLVRPYVPQLDETGVDEAILALREGLADQQEDQPLYIDVHDDEDGEHVQIFIG